MRRLARATLALALLAGGAFPAAADRPPRLKAIVSPIVAGPNPFEASGPSLGRPTPSPELASPYSTLSVGVQDDGTLDSPLLAAINDFRRAHRLSALGPSPRLARAALGHVRALAYAGAFEHAWPDGRGFSEWMRRYYPGGAGRAVVGENLLWSTGPRGSVSAQEALRLWLASPPHRRILLTPDWRELGIATVAARQAQGVYGGRDVLIVATEFGARI